MRFETESGVQSYVDFGEFRFENDDGTVSKLYLFSMILGCSRQVYTEFVLFFRFIANRYEKASTIIASNNALSDWTELFQDPIAVMAFPDRLLHCSVIINIKGSSCGLYGKIEKKSVEMSQI